MEDTKIEGVGKDAPTVTNEKGGQQSRVDYRFDLLDPAAMFEMTKVLAEGARKYTPDNWRLIPVREHLNHMVMHAYAYMAGDKSDEHLSHIMCRAMFAQAVAIQDGDAEEKASLLQRLKQFERMNKQIAEIADDANADAGEAKLEVLRLTEQIDRLAKYITENYPEEITDSGAVDVAIKIMRKKG